MTIDELIHKRSMRIMTQRPHALMQCPKCGNSQRFEIDVVTQTERYVVTQALPQCAEEGASEDAYDWQWQMPRFPWKPSRAWDLSLAECTCLGHPETTDTCSYTAPLTDFVVETLRTL